MCNTPEHILILIFKNDDDEDSFADLYGAEVEDTPPTPQSGCKGECQETDASGKCIYHSAEKALYPVSK